MTEGLTWGGIDVASWALRARDLSGLLAMPGRRGENVEVAGRDGAIRQPRKLYQQREFVIEYLVRGATAAGLVPAQGASRQFYDNMDLLSSLCVQDVAPMVHTLPGSPTVQRLLDVEVISSVEPERYKAGMLATVKVAYTAASAWWRASSPTSVTFTLADNGTRVMTEFAPSTGRIDDALVTFGAASGGGSGNNPTLTQVETGIGIGYDHAFVAGRGLRLGDYSWTQLGTMPAFSRTSLRTDLRIGTWWVIDPVPGGAPTFALDLTGAGPLQITVSARQSWAVG